MRKFWVVGTATMLVLALAAVAFAQTVVTNTYDVDASVSPTRAGSKKKPIPVGLKFDYQVGEVEGRRPSPVRKYSIRFAGLQVNSNVAAKCSNNTIEQKGPTGCPAKSIVGNGFIENATGATDNPNDKSVPCNATVTVINVGDRRANIYVAGTPGAADPRARCTIELAAGIPANFVRRGNSTALEFTVPQSLLHPGAATLSNAVTRVTSTIKRITKRVNGKTRGYFEAAGGCSRGARLVTVVFTPESGPSGTAQDRAKCS